MGGGVYVGNQEAFPGCRIVNIPNPRRSWQGESPLDIGLTYPYIEDVVPSEIPGVWEGGGREWRRSG